MYEGDLRKILYQQTENKKCMQCMVEKKHAMLAKKYNLPVIYQYSFKDTKLVTCKSLRSLASLTYNADLHHWAGTLTWNADLYRWIITLTYNADLHHWVGTLTWNADLYRWIVTLTYNADLHHCLATLTCNAYLQRWLASLFKLDATWCMSL